MHKIILCTTFREFDDSANSKIQCLFLDSILKQQYQDFLLVVTTFGEKTVEKKLKDIFKDKCIIYDEKLDGYRYSLSSVLINGIEEARKYDGSVLLWCTCDIILQENYFLTINNLYTSNLVGTTHPNIIAETIEDYYDHEYGYQPIDCGFDILFFSSSIFSNPNVMRILKEYYFYEWGVFEHFLIGIGLHEKCKLINTINESDVIKIENDRKASREPSEFLKGCYDRNAQILYRCILNEYFSPKIWDLSECHKLFAVKKKSLAYCKYYIFESTRCFLLKMNRKIKKRLK